MTLCRRMNFLVKSTYLSHHSILPKKISDGIRWDTKTKGLTWFHCGDKPTRRICPPRFGQWSSPFSYWVYPLMMFTLLPFTNVSCLWMPFRRLLWEEIRRIDWTLSGGQKTFLSVSCNDYWGIPKYFYNLMYETSPCIIQFFIFNWRWDTKVQIYKRILKWFVLDF